MSYAVKEIFYTLQGEGANTGRPAVFCRFAGCNLWTGREEDRATRDLPVLRHRLRRHRRPRRRQVRDRRRRWPTRSPRTGPRRPTDAPGRSWCAPAASRCCSSTRALIDALHDARLRDRGRDQRHAAASAGPRLGVRQPQGRARNSCCSRRRAEAGLPPGAAPSPSASPTLDFDHFFLQPMDGPDVRAQHRAGDRLLPRPTRSGA